MAMLWMASPDQAGGAEPPAEPAFTLEPLEPGLRWAIAAHAYNVSVYNWVEAHEAYRAEVAREAAQRAREAARAVPATTTASYGSGACGGSLPPCSVMMCESQGNIRAQNPRSSASGKWQITSGTWANHRGYATAASAPEWVQDERAAQIYAGGAGRGHWVC